MATTAVIGNDFAPAEDEAWHQLKEFLERIRTDLTPRLRELLSLRGIRFDEMEVLDRYAAELPALCSLVGEIGTLIRSHQRELAALPVVKKRGRKIVAATQMLLQGSTNRKLSSLMIALDERLRDLEAFVPFWLEEIGRRRALMLRPFEDGGRDLLESIKSDEAPLGNE